MNPVHVVFVWSPGVLKKFDRTNIYIDISIFDHIYTVKEANLDLAKHMLLLKNPQFLPNHCETSSK